MVQENKHNRRYKQINFIGLQNNRHPSQHTIHDALQAEKQKEVHCTPLIWRLRVPDQGSTVGGLLSVSLPEKHHKRHTFCRHGSNPRTCDSGFAINS
jgi:hypothetical protein